jgi:hypothetical protein
MIKVYLRNPLNGGKHNERTRRRKGVPKVKKARHEADDIQAREEVEDGIEVHVQSRCAGGQKGAPPPMVILQT